MGVIPMEQEVAGQELYTRDHGTVKVGEMSFMDGGYHIVKCPNGTYMHSNGLPVSSEEELRAAIPPPFLNDALVWFSNRHELDENQPRPIMFNRDGYPVFQDDGSVADFIDLYAYFKPGPVLTAAIVALQEYKAKEAGIAPAPTSKKKIAKVAAAKKRRKGAKSSATV